MKPILIILTLLAVLLGVGDMTPSAFAWIYWDVSVKVFLDQNDKWPASAYPADDPERHNFDTVQQIEQHIDWVNRNMLSPMHWGYRLLLTEIVELRGLTEWFNIDPYDNQQYAALKQAIALRLPIDNAFQYRSGQINVYISNAPSFGGVEAGIPEMPILGDLIVLRVGANRHVLLHEVGHGMGLDHTHGPCNFCDECKLIDPEGSLDDNIADTIPDSACWNKDTVGYKNFNILTYNLLNATQQVQVDNVWYNLMSYHINKPLLTHDQWERLVDISNIQRRDVASGGTIFVDKDGPGISPDELIGRVPGLVAGLPGGPALSWYTDWLAQHPPTGPTTYLRTCKTFIIDPPFPPPPPNYPSNWPWGSDIPQSVWDLWPNRPPEYPTDWPWPPFDPPAIDVCVGGFKTLQAAIDAAAPGDRIQVKAGSYNVPINIPGNKRLTIATDRGSAFIGRP